MKLIHLDLSKREVSAVADALDLLRETLELSAMVVAVGNPTQNTLAVEAQKRLAEYLKAIENARTSAKAPFLDLGRKVDALAKDLKREAEAELDRVAGLIGDYQTLELAKERAAAAARQKEIDDLERQKQEQLAAAKSHDDLDKIHADFNERAACLPVQQFAPRPEGQTVTADLEITVTDIYALARVHPQFVKMEPRLREIKEAIRAGVKVHGVTWKETVRAGVRTTKPETVSV